MASGIARKMGLIGVLALISCTGAVSPNVAAHASHAAPATGPTVIKPICGSTIAVPGSYQLGGNVGPCVGDGIVIGANNVTLDLRGHRIAGDQTSDAVALALVTANTLNVCPAPRAGDVGIRIEGRTGVKVTDSTTTGTTWGGEVTGFDAGVFINKGSANTVEKSLIENNYNIGTEVPDHGDGIAILDSSNNVVVDNRILHNGPYSGVGVYKTQPTSGCAGTTSGNTIGRTGPANSPANGGNVISHNDIAVGNTNQDDGIRLEPSVKNNVVENNTIERNGLEGIAVFFGGPNDPTSGNTIKSNKVNFNGFHEYVGSPMSPTCPVGTSDPYPRPVVVPGNQNTPLPKPCYNMWSHRKGDGIRVFGPTHTQNATTNTITGNTVCGNAASGIRVDGGMKAGSTNTADRNTIGANVEVSNHVGDYSVTGCATNKAFNPASIADFDVMDFNLSANLAAGLAPCNSNDWLPVPTGDSNDTDGTINHECVGEDLVP